ncbi:hypothetical protein MVES_003612 [Malassezia vespertilionis]|uniref:tRNA N(3)-methylcytidine methyltransferase n=1 Tax=Malassezia vespertilionis TaxID=2020962 RepID=A0A2N1J767_9BASI|nr:hypothetical protein MVES_003612 [Malassezia vespertilionis]
MHARTHTGDGAKATSSVMPVQREDVCGAPPTDTHTHMSADHTTGARTLGSADDVWQFNAWDHVEPPPEHRAQVQTLLARQAEARVSDTDAHAYHEDPAKYWDTFYARHENRFFKDRKWLHLEFPELLAATKRDAPPTTILEVGCGAGNTVFPLLRVNENPGLRLIACDYAPQAVHVIRSHPLYTSPSRIGTCEAHVWDLSAKSKNGSLLHLPPGVEPGQVDIIVLIFVLSALHPDEWAAAADNVYQMLRPRTGIVLLRDYGRHDLPQLRFKKNRLLQDNFYVRGDGTRVYFFEADELYRMFDAAPKTSPHQHAHFQTLQMAVDRRLLVNRKERKQMYRVWLQAKLQKQ